MAKNKNKNRQQRDQRTRPAEEQVPEPKNSAVEHIQGTPNDVARKHKRKFGHN